MERTSDKMKDPLFRFLEREVNMAGVLLKTIHKQLKDVNAMCLGTTNATNLLKQLALDLHAEQVPKQWHKF
jgi:dynein heavy chain 1